MQPVYPISKCPHCGGISGYTTRVVLTAKQTYTWDGVGQDMGLYLVAAESDPRCADCDKPVRALIKKVLEINTRE